MSYNRTVFLGWYAEFDKSPLKVVDSVKRTRTCPSNKNHKITPGDFCPQCGTAISEIDEPKYRSIASPHRILPEQDPEEIAYMTLGRADHWDISRLDGSHAISPEFLATNKVIIMAPGFVQIDDDRDGFVKEFPTEDGRTVTAAPDPSWTALLEKVFDAQNIKIKFGVVLEIK